MMLLGAIASGCSKEKPPTPTADTSAVTNATVAVSQVAPSPQAAVDPTEVGGKITEANTALTAKDYTKAATVLSLPQTTIAAMNANQVAAYTSAKNALARSVVAAATAGDPNAKAAMEKLRQDALYHR